MLCSGLRLIRFRFNLHSLSWKMNQNSPLIKYPYLSQPRWRRTTSSATKRLRWTIQSDGKIRVVVTVLLERFGRGSRLCNEVDVVLQPWSTQYGLGRFQTKAATGHGCLPFLLLAPLQKGRITRWPWETVHQIFSDRQLIAADNSFTPYLFGGVNWCHAKWRRPNS